MQRGREWGRRGAGAHMNFKLSSRPSCVGMVPLRLLRSNCLQVRGEGGGQGHAALMSSCVAEGAGSGCEEVLRRTCFSSWSSGRAALAWCRSGHCKRVACIQVRCVRWINAVRAPPPLCTAAHLLARCIPPPRPYALLPNDLLARCIPPPRGEGDKGAVWLTNESAW